MLCERCGETDATVIVKEQTSGLFLGEEVRYRDYNLCAACSQAFQEEAKGRTIEGIDPSVTERMFKSFERQYDLRSGFVKGLLTGDDWSDVIRLHALIEAAITQLLVTQLDDERLRRGLERLHLSGKLRFVEDLSLLPAGQVKFIRALSELRNGMVHDVHSVHYTFATELGTLPDKERISRLKGFVAWAGEINEALWLDRARINPKEAIWMGVVLVLLEVQNHRLKLGWDRDHT